MRRGTHLRSVLESGGLILHRLVGSLFGLRFVGQSVVLGLLAVALVLASGIADGTLILPGKNIGVLEHPTIWTIIVLQVGLPLTTQYSLLRLLRSRYDLQRIAGNLRSAPKTIANDIIGSTRLETRQAMAVAGLVYTVGLAAFVWNSYQNQLPAGSVVPFDFWDSRYHPVGYWTTRAYKFYVYVLLLPYLTLIHVAIITALLSNVHRNRIAGNLTLEPFHPDGAGGLGSVASLMSVPIVVGLVVAGVSSGAALWVHKELDLTPVLALGSLVVTAIVAYVVPAFLLGGDIRALKKRLIRELRAHQQQQYELLTDAKHLDPAAVAVANESLSYFDKVCARVQAIPTFPHWRRLLKVATVALTPSVISLVLKAIETLGLSLHLGPVRP